MAPPPSLKVLVVTCAVSAVLPLGGAWTSDLEAELQHQDQGTHHKSDLLAGFVEGISLDQPFFSKANKAKCRELLGEVSPLIRVVESTADACLQRDATRCVTSFGSSIKGLSEHSPDFLQGVKLYCPRKLYLIFTAAYDPFLPANMATLSVLHIDNVYGYMHTLSQEGPQDPYALGRAMGGLANQLIPALRLPLTEDEMDSLITGFVSSFEIGSHSELRRMLRGPPRPGQPLSDVVNTTALERNKPHITEACLSGIRDDVAPMNDVLRQITSTVLNQTCMTSSPLSCSIEGFSSCGSFISIIQDLASLHHDQRKTCPRGFLKAMRRVDGFTSSLLDMSANFLEKMIPLQSLGNQALEAFYANDLQKFGEILGLFLLDVTKPAFFRYRTIEIDWTEVTTMQRNGLSTVVPMCLTILGAVLLQSMFCSTLFGRPSKRQEISMRPISGHANLLIDYSFFGSGPFEVNSEIEFDMVPRPRSSGSLTSSSASLKGSDSEDGNNNTNNMEPNDSDGRKSSNSTFAFDAWEDFGPVASWRTLAETTTERFRLRLTDELPRRGCICAFITRTIASWFLCDACSAKRRWEVERSKRRRNGPWVQQDEHDNCWLKCCGKRFIERSLRSVGLYSDREYLRPEGRDSDDDAASDLSQDEVMLQTKGQVYLDGIEQHAPIKDHALPISARMSEVSAAVIRLKPSDDFRECWDTLFFVAAAAQLIGSVGHLLQLLLNFGSVLWGGEMATWWWWWSSMCISAVALHKKIHARWWVCTHNDERRGFSGKASCLALMFNGTTTPVSLFGRAPAVPDAGGDDRCSMVSSASDPRSSRASSKRRSELGWFCRFWTCLVSIPGTIQGWFQQLRKWGLTLLMYLRPLAYTFTAEVKPDDLVRIRTTKVGFVMSVMSKVAPGLLPERYQLENRLGRLDGPPEDGLYRVVFEPEKPKADVSSISSACGSGSGSASGVSEMVDLEAQLGDSDKQRPSFFLYNREEFELENLYKAGGWAFPCRAGHWHDRLTGQLWRGLLVTFAAGFTWLALLPPDIVADDDGYMMLHLVADEKSPFTLNATSLMFEIQFGCLGVELAIRVFNWAIGRCLLAALYRRSG